MEQRSHSATLSAVLLGVLVIGTCLPFDSEAPGSLWGNLGTGPNEAFTRLAAIGLCVVLITGALDGVGLWLGLTQIAAGILVAALTGNVAISTESPPGSGGTLVVVTALLIALVGLVEALVSLVERYGSSHPPRAA